MKEPGPDHPITIEKNPHRIRVLVGGVIVAETTQALTLKEATLPAVQYIPRQDAQMDLFERTEQTSHCPFTSLAGVSAKFSTQPKWRTNGRFAAAMSCFDSCVCRPPSGIDMLDCPLHSQTSPIRTSET